MKRIQIGIVGSAKDLNYSNDALLFVKKLGQLIAQSNNILVYGAEKDDTSLPMEAAREATKYGGMTVGIKEGKDKNTNSNFEPTISINTGLETGGGREFTLVLSCDVIIAISGGAGTLTEMAIAYQAGIPIIAVENFEGWAKTLANKYFDERQRIKCLGVKSAEDALELAIKMVNGR